MLIIKLPDLLSVLPGADDLLCSGRGQRRPDAGFRNRWLPVIQILHKAAHGCGRALLTAQRKPDFPESGYGKTADGDAVGNALQNQPGEDGDAEPPFHHGQAWIKEKKK